MSVLLSRTIVSALYARFFALMAKFIKKLRIAYHFRGGIYANLGCRAIDGIILLNFFKESKAIRQIKCFGCLKCEISIKKKREFCSRHLKLG